MQHDANEKNVHDSKENQPSDSVATRVGHRRALVTVWFTLFLDLLGFGMILPVLPYYAEFHGASPTVVTLLSSSFSLAQFVMSPVLGRISDRRGRRPVMLISIFGSCLAMLLLGLAQSLVLVFAARFVSGVCNANISTAHAYVADRVAPEQRARYMGIMGSAIGFGFVVGPALGGLLSVEASPTLPFFVAAGLAAINFLMAWRWLPESHRPQLQAQAVARGEAEPPRAKPTSHRMYPLLDWRRWMHGALGQLVLVNFGFFFAFASMESTYALFAERRFGWTARETGAMFGALGLVIVLIQGFAVGKLVAAFREKRTLLVGIVSLIVGFSTMAFSGSDAVLVVGTLFVAAGNGLVTSNVSALVSRASTAQDQGVSLGISASAASLARILGPMAAGFAFERLGIHFPFVVGACVLVAVWIAAAVGIREPGSDRGRNG